MCVRLSALGALVYLLASSASFHRDGPTCSREPPAALGHALSGLVDGSVSRTWSHVTETLQPSCCEQGAPGPRGQELDRGPSTGWPAVLPEPLTRRPHHRTRPSGLPVRGVAVGCPMGLSGGGGVRSSALCLRGAGSVSAPHPGRPCFVTGRKGEFLFLWCTPPPGAGFKNKTNSLPPGTWQGSGGDVVGAAAVAGPHGPHSHRVHPAPSPRSQPSCWGARSTEHGVDPSCSGRDQAVAVPGLSVHV